MGITLELLMITDRDIEALTRKPKDARAFIKRGGEFETGLQKRRSMGIGHIFDRIDYVLRAGRSPDALPLGFLQADGQLIGKVKRIVRFRVGDEIVRYPEYQYEDDFHYGPPHAFFSAQVVEIAHALDPVDNIWVRQAYNPDDLYDEAERQRLTPSDHDARIEECQEIVRELKAFISRAASSQMGLIRYIW